MEVAPSDQRLNSEKESSTRSHLGVRGATRGRLLLCIYSLVKAILMWLYCHGIVSENIVAFFFRLFPKLKST